MRTIRNTIFLATILLATTVSAQVISVNCTADGGTNCQGLIPDGLGSLVSTITVPTGCNGTLGNVTVPVSVTHDWVGDLDIRLTHVDTGTTTLLLDTSSCPRDDISATFSSASVTPAQCAFTIPAISGLVQPAGSLVTFNGEDPAGTWTLTLRDLSFGGNGALNDWTFVADCVPPTTVTIVATDPTATEGVDTGTFTVTRTGPTTAALVVNYTIGGTAGVGDYAPLSGNVTIPIGSATATITVVPAVDVFEELTETVVATVAAGDYLIGTPSVATVSILDATVTEAIPVASPTGLLLMALLLAAAGAFVVLRGR